MIWYRLSQLFSAIKSLNVEYPIVSKVHLERGFLSGRPKLSWLSAILNPYRKNVGFWVARPALSWLHWPFGILTDKTILRLEDTTQKKKRCKRESSFLLSQGIVGYSKRVNWCLSCVLLLRYYNNLQLVHSGKKGSQTNEDPCSSTWHSIRMYILPLAAVRIIYAHTWCTYTLRATKC